MGVYYVNCIGDATRKNEEYDFYNIEEAILRFEEKKKEKGWLHIEITKQINVFTPEL